MNEENKKMAAIFLSGPQTSEKERFIENAKNILPYYVDPIFEMPDGLGVKHLTSTSYSYIPEVFYIDIRRKDLSDIIILLNQTFHPKSLEEMKSHLVCFGQDHFTPPSPLENWIIFKRLKLDYLDGITPETGEGAENLLMRGTTKVPPS